MVYLTVKSEFLNALLDYLNTSIVNYISYNLEEQGQIISFCIRLNYDLEIEQIEQINILITKKAWELQERRTFSRLDIRKQTFHKKILNNMFSLFTKCCFFKQKSDNIRLINTDILKRKIIIGYCRRYETFIFIIKLQGYKDQYKRLVPKKFSYKSSY